MNGSIVAHRLSTGKWPGPIGHLYWVTVNIVHLTVWKWFVVPLGVVAFAVRGTQRIFHRVTQLRAYVACDGGMHGRNSGRIGHLCGKSCPVTLHNLCHVITYGRIMERLFLQLRHRARNF